DQKFSYVLKTGNWTSNTNKRTNKKGVTAIVQRMCYGATLAYMKKINTPLGKEGTLSKPRQLQGDSESYICLSDTPESDSIGLVNVLSVASYVSVGDKSFQFIDIVNNMIDKPLHLCDPRVD